MQLRLRQFELRHRCNIEPVEAPCVLDHRNITRGSHGTEDFADRRVDALVGLGGEGQQGVERAHEFGRTRIKAADGRLAHGQLLRV